MVRSGGNARRNQFATLTDVPESSRPAVFFPTVDPRLFSPANATNISAALAVWQLTSSTTLPGNLRGPSPSISPECFDRRKFDYTQSVLIKFRICPIPR